MRAMAIACGRDATGRRHGVLDIISCTGSMAGRVIFQTLSFFVIVITGWFMKTTGRLPRQMTAGS
jgi:hypothetical protein